MNLRICLVVVFSCVLPLSALYVELQRHFEFEDILTEEQQDLWVWRSEASMFRTLRLADSERIYRVELYICPHPIPGEDNVTINLDDIRYANDGPLDAINVTLNGDDWAKYYTFEKWAWGHDWNVFRNTGNLGKTVSLPKGQHTIGVSVETDPWGIELDKIRLLAEYHDIEKPLFCGGKLILQWQLA